MVPATRRRDLARELHGRECDESDVLMVSEITGSELAACSCSSLRKRPGLLGRPNCKGVAIGVARRGVRRSGERTLRIPPSCSLPVSHACRPHVASFVRRSSVRRPARGGAPTTPTTPTTPIWRLGRFPLASIGVRHHADLASSQCQTAPYRCQSLPFRALSLRFRAPSLRFRALSLPFRALSLRFRALSLWFRALSLWFRALSLRFRALSLWSALFPALSLRGRCPIARSPSPSGRGSGSRHLPAEHAATSKRLQNTKHNQRRH